MIQRSQITAASKQWFKWSGEQAAHLFGRNACISKESGEKEVSLRTIAQDLTSFSKFDHSGYWWDVTQVWTTNIPAGRISHPENGWDLGGTVFCCSKDLWNPPTTLNPELLPEIRSSGFTDGKTRNSLVMIGDMSIQETKTSRWEVIEYFKISKTNKQRYPNSQEHWVGLLQATL